MEVKIKYQSTPFLLILKMFKRFQVQLVARVIWGGAIAMPVGYHIHCATFPLSVLELYPPQDQSYKTLNGMMIAKKANIVNPKNAKISTKRM
jgi:hypothetical protein